MGVVNATTQEDGSSVRKHHHASPPSAAFVLNKLKLRSKYFNASGIVHKLHKKNSSLLVLSSTASTTSRQHDIVNARALDATHNMLGNFKYPANLFANNKTFLDIKSEFIMFLRNRLAATQVENSTILPTTISLSQNKINSTKYHTLKANLAYAESNDELYNPDSISYFKFNNNNGSDEVFNIWKLAFFMLAFVIGLVFLLTVLTLSLKLIFSKFRKKSRFQVKSINHCNTLMKKPSHANRHQVSSISFCEYNSSASGLCGDTKFDHIPKAQIQRTRTVSLSSMSTNATLGRQHELIKKTMVDQNMAARLCETIKNENEWLNKRPMVINSFKYNSNPNLSQLDDRFIKSSSMIDSIFESKTPSYFCDIAADRTFLDDIDLGRVPRAENRDAAGGGEMKCFTSFKNGLVYTISKSHGQQVKTNSLGFTQNMNEEKTGQCKKIEIGFERKQCGTNDGFIPWRLTATTSGNEYEGLEAESMSGVTSYSEVIEENDVFSGEDGTSSSSEYNGDDSAEMVKDVDLIHGSDRYESKKVTKELEMKLKERRDLFETSKFKPKILSEETSDMPQHFGLKRNQFQGNIVPPPTITNFNSAFSSTLPNSNRPPINRNQTESSGIEKNRVNETEPKRGHQLIKPLFCPKSAAAVKYEIINKDDQIEANECLEKVRQSLPFNADFSHRNPKIIVDNFNNLPAKRESIKMLIDNKLVSENKQRTDLESQLNALLKYSKSTSK